MSAFSDLAVRIATECKSLRTLINGNVANLNALTTTNKTNLVAAINELKTTIGAITPGDSVTQREHYIDEFYANSSSTDSDALAKFFTDVGEGTLKFRVGEGRGPSGRYLIDREIKYTGNGRIILDFQFATVRWTTPTACIRYSPPASSSNTIYFDHFGIRNGVFQYAAEVDTLVYWDFPFRSARISGTGFAENIRITPQDGNNSGHTLKYAFRTKNCWHMPFRDVYVAGKPAGSSSALLAGSAFIKQEGLCVVQVIDHCEVYNFDQGVILGSSKMLGINGTFVSGTYAHPKRLRQGSTIGMFARNDGAYGYQYSLWDVVGTFTNGACEVLDTGGNNVGTFNITASSVYSQNSEAVQVCNGTTFVNVNYMVDWATPADSNGNKFIDFTMSDSHVAFWKGAIRADGFATTVIGSGVTVQPYANNTITWDINNGDMITINGTNSPTNGRTGNTFVKLRNINGGVITSNNLIGYSVPWDTDNTVKDTTIANNTGYLCGIGANTGNKYNLVNTRGLRFKNNGAMGVGHDMDDNRRIAFTPVVSSAGGSISTYTPINCHYTLCNGVLTCVGTIIIQNRGTATGALFISMSAIPNMVSMTGSIGFPVSAMQPDSAQAMFGIYDPINNRIAINRSGSSEGFVNSVGTAGNYSYSFSFSIPVVY